MRSSTKHSKQVQRVPSAHMIHVPGALPAVPRLKAAPAAQIHTTHLPDPPLPPPPVITCQQCSPCLPPPPRNSLGNTTPIAPLSIHCKSPAISSQTCRASPNLTRRPHTPICATLLPPPPSLSTPAAPGLAWPPALPPHPFHAHRLTYQPSSPCPQHVPATPWATPLPSHPVTSTPPQLLRFIHTASILAPSPPPLPGLLS